MNLVDISVKCHQRKGQRGVVVRRERMSTQDQARIPEVDELSCVPETEQSQQAAGVEEVVVGAISLNQGHTGHTGCWGDTEGQGQRQGQVKDQGVATCIRRQG